MNKKLERLIAQSDIVSFDIFDTLIYRKCGNYKGVFALVAQKMEEPEEFVTDRIRAERIARKKKKTEITIEDIYAEMKGKEASWNRTCIATEKATELEMCVQNPEMKDIFDYCHKNRKQIIIITDMYLDKKTIVEILTICGYRDYDKIYISSVCGEKKSDGKIFKRILSELNIPANTMLHIGDNWKSDYFMPKIKGIKTYWYKDGMKSELPRGRSSDIMGKREL